MQSSNGTSDLFNTYCCIHNFNWTCWHLLEVLTIRSKNFIYVLRKFKQHGLSCECTEQTITVVIYGLTGENAYDDAGDVVVGTATLILAGVGHLAVPHRQHADQRRALGLLGDYEARLGVRNDRTSVLVPGDVDGRLTRRRRVADELDRTSSRHVLAVSYLLEARTRFRSLGWLLGNTVVTNSFSHSAVVVSE